MRLNMNPVHRGLRTLSLLGLLLCLGCPPTLSRPRSPEHLDALAVGERHARHGRYEEAAASFGEAAVHADRRVDRDEAEYRQARVLRRAGDDAAALGLFDAIAERRPVSRRTVRAHYDAARLRFALGQQDQGREALFVLLRSWPDSAMAKSALKFLFRQRQSDEAALVWLRELYGLVENSEIGDNLLMMQVRLHQSAGREDEVEALLRRIIEDHPYPQGHRWDEATLMLSEMLHLRGQTEDALALLEEFLAHAEETSLMGSYTLPTFAEAQLRRGRLLWELGRQDDAEDAFRELGEMFPHSRLIDDALLELAQLRAADGDEAAACAIYDEILERFEVGRARRRAAEAQERCQSGGSSS